MVFNEKRHFCGAIYTGVLEELDKMQAPFCSTEEWVTPTEVIVETWVEYDYEDTQTAFYKAVYLAGDIEVLMVTDENYKVVKGGCVTLHGKLIYQGLDALEIGYRLFVATKCPSEFHFKKI